MDIQSNNVTIFNSKGFKGKILKLDVLEVDVQQGKFSFYLFLSKSAEQPLALPGNANIFKGLFYL